MFRKKKIDVSCRNIAALEDRGGKKTISVQPAPFWHFLLFLFSWFLFLGNFLFSLCFDSTLCFTHIFWHAHWIVKWTGNKRSKCVEYYKSQLVHKNVACTAVASLSSSIASSQPQCIFYTTQSTKLFFRLVSSYFLPLLLHCFQAGKQSHQSQIWQILWQQNASRLCVCACVCVFVGGGVTNFEFTVTLCPKETSLIVKKVGQSGPKKGEVSCFSNISETFQSFKWTPFSSHGFAWGTVTPLVIILQ